MHDVLAGEFANSKLDPMEIHFRPLEDTTRIEGYFRSYSQSRTHHGTRCMKINSTKFLNQRLRWWGQIYETLCSRLVYHIAYRFSWYTQQHQLLPWSEKEDDIKIEIHESECLKRFMKVNNWKSHDNYYCHSLKNARILAQSLEKESRLKKKESASYRRSPSCDDVENDIKRMRSIWFPSPRLGALIVIPVDMF